MQHILQHGCLLCTFVTDIILNNIFDIVFRKGNVLCFCYLYKFPHAFPADGLQFFIDSELTVICPGQCRYRITCYIQHPFFPYHFVYVCFYHYIQPGTVHQPVNILYNIISRIGRCTDVSHSRIGEKEIFSIHNGIRSLYVPLQYNILWKRLAESLECIDSILKRKKNRSRCNHRAQIFYRRFNIIIFHTDNGKGRLFHQLLCR